MGRFVNPDNSAFQVALNSKIYIDKTGLIEYTNSVLDTSDAYICNSRPRRFGKSYTANMLAAYYSKGCNSEEMFSGLDISRKSDFKTHLNQYDVIHIDIQWFLANCYNSNKIVSFLSDSVISELRDIYPDILPLGELSLPDSLSRIKDKTGQKFIIIIDEWDVLIRDEATNYYIQNEYINFLRGMFKGTEPTKYIQLAYLTGILPIKKEKTQSAVNNLEEFTMLHSYELAPYIGFTENEVKMLCQKYDRDFEKVKKWYDGYLLENYEIYNPKAVVSVMLRGKFRSYWSETGSYEVIVPLINMNYDGLKNTIIEMLSGQNVKVNTLTFKNDPANIQNKDDVITYLIHLGYLGYNEKDETAFIPNEEIRHELINAVKSTNWSDLIHFQYESNHLLDATLSMNTQEAAEQIQKIHSEYASSIQYNDENALSYTIDLAYYAARDHYTVIRELPTGKGFADLAFIPKTDKPAILVELKWNQGVNTAITQIKEKKYPSVLEKYKGNLLLVGITYDKKTRKHICKIERL